MEITIDLDVTASTLKANIEKLVRVLPDELLLMGLDHYRHERMIPVEGASDLIRAGLKATLIRSLREEMGRRVEMTR